MEGRSSGGHVEMWVGYGSHRMSSGTVALHELQLGKDVVNGETQLGQH